MLKAVRKAFGLEDSKARFWQFWVEAQDRVADHTPDIIELEQHDFQFVFLYNEMQIGQRKYSMIGDASVNFATAFSPPDFVLWKKHLGQETFPIALRNENKLGKSFGTTSRLGYPARIKGELHAIRPYRMIDVDNYLLNGIYFRRRRVIVDVPFRYTNAQGLPKVYSELQVKKQEAWMYIGVRSFWNDQLDQGYMFSPVTIYSGATTKSFAEQYYYFNEHIESS